VSGDLGDFLTEGGAVVDGAAALGATLGFIVGSLVHDFRAETDSEQWAQRGGLLAGVFGLACLPYGGVDSDP
jgi:hypothetical protein